MHHMPTGVHLLHDAMTSTAHVTVQWLSACMSRLCIYENTYTYPQLFTPSDSPTVGCMAQW